MSANADIRSTPHSSARTGRTGGAVSAHGDPALFPARRAPSEAVRPRFPRLCARRPDGRRPPAATDEAARGIQTP